jgi:hypothetical protein
MAFEPNHENHTQRTQAREVYHYYNSEGKPLFKSKKLSGEKVVFFRYIANPILDIAKPKSIKIVEFRGWKPSPVF